jgi:hypothetical protein
MPAQFPVAHYKRWAMDAFEEKISQFQFYILWRDKR